MYTAKNYDYLLGIEGMSDDLLKNHFTLYQGYVSNFNKLYDLVVKMSEEDKLSTPEFAEIKRRLGWEFNGMRLHELYFHNLKKDGSIVEKKSKIYQQIVKDYGSLEFWEKYFKATGAMRGVGWVVMCYEKEADKLLTVWINEHDVGHLVGATPILVMDVFEHAYMLDYGLKRAEYIDIFLKNVDWSIVEKRMI